MCPRSLLCGPRGERGPPGSYKGEREQALALLAAAKHLPSQLLSSQAEVKGKCDELWKWYILLKIINAGMLVQAARMLDNLGDKRMVEQCNKLMANLSSNLASM